MLPNIEDSGTVRDDLKSLHDAGRQFTETGFVAPVLSLHSTASNPEVQNDHG
jgi:hypothetical protein